jgi:L-ascorbate metabolism protein UlaG (beta-lactamase superfamily)
MKIRWFGQSAYLLTAGDQRVFIDPFGDLRDRLHSGARFDYPLIEGVDADVLLVTHEHFDHNGVEVIGGDPQIVRGAGTHETPIGEVVGINSEHDQVAGTQRGPNTIFRFTLDGITFAHFGDFGQRALRPEQREALGEVDVLFLPVGAGPTILVDDAAALVRELSPRLLVPMHYGNAAVSFLDPPDAFFAALGTEAKPVATEFDAGEEGVVLVEVPA